MEVVVTTGAVSRAKLQSKCHHQQTTTQFFTGWMPFLSPNQQCQEHWRENYLNQYWQAKQNKTKHIKNKIIENNQNGPSKTYKTYPEENYKRTEQILVKLSFITPSQEMDQALLFFNTCSLHGTHEINVTNVIFCKLKKCGSIFVIFATKCV